MTEEKKQPEWKVGSKVKFILEHQVVHGEIMYVRVFFFFWKRYLVTYDFVPLKAWEQRRAVWLRRSELFNR